MPRWEFVLSFVDRFLLFFRSDQHYTYFTWRRGCINVINLYNVGRLFGVMYVLRPEEELAKETLVS